MQKLEALHFPHSDTWDCYNDCPLEENHARKSAEITKDIAMKFAEFLMNNYVSYCDNKHCWWEPKDKETEYTTKQLFTKFLKTI